MPSAVAAPQTLYDKVLRDHTVDEKDDGTILLYIGMPITYRRRKLPVEVVQSLTRKT